MNKSKIKISDYLTAINILSLTEYPIAKKRGRLLTEKERLSSIFYVAHDLGSVLSSRKIYEKQTLAGLENPTQNTREILVDAVSEAYNYKKDGQTENAIIQRLKTIPDGELLSQAIQFVTGIDALNAKFPDETQVAYAMQVINELAKLRSLYNQRFE